MSAYRSCTEIISRELKSYQERYQKDNFSYFDEFVDQYETNKAFDSEWWMFYFTQSQRRLIYLILNRCICLVNLRNPEPLIEEIELLKEIVLKMQPTILRGLQRCLGHSFCSIGKNQYCENCNHLMVSLFKYRHCCCKMHSRSAYSQYTACTKHILVIKKDNKYKKMARGCHLFAICKKDCSIQCTSCNQFISDTSHCCCYR